MLSALRDPYTAYLTPPSYRLRHGSSVVGLDAAKPLNRVVGAAAEVRLLRSEGAEGFVLDLSGDPGGLLSHAVAVSSLFLDGGVVVSLYYTPDGHEIDHVGVTPAVPAVDDPATSEDEALLTGLRALAQPAS